MKTSIKNLIATTFGLIVLTTVSFKVQAEDNNVTVLAEVKKVNKINVSGNVEVIIVQSAEERVNVYDNYYTKNALVQQKDGELRISSYANEKLTVVVYLNQLKSIIASDKAQIRTSGELTSLALDITLKDQASASLNVNAIELNTQVSNAAALNLVGKTIDYNAFVSANSQVKMNGFTTENSSIIANNQPVGQGLLGLTIAE